MKNEKNSPLKLSSPGRVRTLMPVEDFPDKPISPPIIKKRPKIGPAFTKKRRLSDVSNGSETPVKKMKEEVDTVIDSPVDGMGWNGLDQILLF